MQVHASHQGREGEAEDDDDDTGDGVVVAGATIAHAYDDLYYLERASLHQVIAQSTGRPLVPVDPEMAAHAAAQIQGEREQSDLFFEALRRMLPPPHG